VADVSAPANPPALISDSTWMRLDATTLLAGSPVRLFRVTAAGGRVLDAIEQGSALPAAHTRLTDRLLAAGAVHPVATPAGVRLDDVTVVVPTFGEPVAAVVRLLAGLAGIAAIVVDDGAPRALDGGALPGRARLIRLAANRGPGAARNAGLAEVATPYVLFIDADAHIGADDLRRLLGHLTDARVGAAAPRVLAQGGSNVIGRYEAVRSPLDMGPQPALVRAGTRVSYVPAAALLCRTEAVRRVGGFDESLRYGEDVDLVWRLADAGWAVRYEPLASAHHAVRTSLRSLLRQRYRYGTSAAALERRHPGVLAPVRLSRWGAAGWASLAAGHPVTAAAIAAAGGVPMARTLRMPGGRPRWVAAARLTATGTAYAGRQLADATTSVWWPVAVPAALLSRRARRVVLAAALLPGAIEWAVRRPRLDPLRFVGLRLLERAAYGLGVWRGALTARRLGPLLPALEARRTAPGDQGAPRGHR
jgi:mycofactocin system glycosyltransferase